MRAKILKSFMEFLTSWHDPRLRAPTNAEGLCILMSSKLVKDVPEVAARKTLKKQIDQHATVWSFNLNSNRPQRASFKNVNPTYRSLELL